ncbi:MAG: hypothetical protein EOM03_18030 [Clostridia bacterium]|nr:hypothetical protein [Clostridia bacterium]
MALVNAFGDIALDASVLAVKAAVEALYAASFFAETATALDSAATFTGDTHDTGNAFSRVAVTALSDVASASGGFKIEVSANGTDGWTAVVAGSLAAGEPLQIQAVLTARYWRVVLINGASAQASLSVTSGQFRI